MPDKPQATNGEDIDFRELLKQILSSQQSRDALLIDLVFQRRLKIICKGLTRNATDADELANHVRFVVYERLDQFEPNYEQPCANFFRWVRRIAQNKVIDDHRHRSVHQEDSQLDEVSAVHDDKVDVEAQAERHEAIERFWGVVSRRQQLTEKIVQYHMQDYSLREIEEKLAAEGIQLSHVAIGNLVRKVVADFIASEDGLRDRIAEKR